LRSQKTEAEKKEKIRETDRQTDRAKLLVIGYQCNVGYIHSTPVAPGDSYKKEQQSINSTC
jgi:hypothetical protein